jgi:hypothetical protein
MPAYLWAEMEGDTLVVKTVAIEVSTALDNKG